MSGLVWVLKQYEMPREASAGGKDIKAIVVSVELIRPNAGRQMKTFTLLGQLDRSNLGLAVLAGAGFELQRLALGNGLDPGLMKLFAMEEYVGATFVGDDEAEAAIHDEELHDSTLHRHASCN